jgi:hypothetical protein
MSVPLVDEEKLPPLVKPPMQRRLERLDTDTLGDAEFPVDVLTFRNVVAPPV